MHEIGNLAEEHLSALLAYNILKDSGMQTSDRLEIMMAICNNDQKAVSDISAALILADKLDVLNEQTSTFEANDRLNHAILDTEMIIDSDKRNVILNLTIDTRICTILECFEIFMNRIQIINCATNYLGTRFELSINDINLL